MRMTLAAGITLMVCGVAFMAYLGYLRSHPPAAMGAGRMDGGDGQTISGPPLKIPAFSLVDQEGRPRDRSMLEGRVSVVWFMFTHCPLACPAMSIQMAELQKRLKASGVQFVAFTLDPVRDTPGVLKEYGDRYSIDWGNWTFLTEPNVGGHGAKRTGWDIFTRDLNQYAEERKVDPPAGAEPGRPPETTIDHGVNFFLVGPDGTVIKWFNSNRPEDMASLRERALATAKFYEDKGGEKAKPN